MGHTFRSILASTAVLGLPLAAVAQAAGNIDAMSDEMGSVIVTRGGATYSLVAGDPVFDGDRITTRSNGTVTISANGCTITLEAESSAVVNDAFCNVEIVSLSSESSTSSFELFEGSQQAYIILGGLGAVGVVAAASGRSGDSGSTPTSP